MQFESIVIRVFDADFMLLDLFFTCAWVVILYKKGYIKPILFGLMGITINFTIDYGLWYSVMGIRIVEGLPIWMSPFAFFVYFSITYGVMQYSYVQVMFTNKPDQPELEKRERIQMSVLFFGGWLLIAYLSVLAPINDIEVTVIRIMNQQRIIEVFVVVVEFALLGLLAHKHKFGINWRTVRYIFFVGFFVHFSMEITLYLPGIRQSSVFDLIFNSLVEFNMGAPILYLMLNLMVPHLEKRKTRSNVF
ncbi:hypothetical protein EU528_04260 [Candidatus Thorarchaeota archaeon]|nr:MAG: hypothetical protein EU528_04260 [Candidatus Thorarchaeota archaeon]